MLRSANPALKTLREQRAAAGEKVMTVQGTVNRTLMLVAMTALGAMYAWSNAETFMRLWLPLVIGGLIVAMITIFKPAVSPFTAPVYAVVEGLFLGAISALFNRMYPGIVFQAVMLTFGVLFALLLAYTSGLIRASAAFKRGVIAATGAVFLVYLVDIVLGVFGVNVPFLHQSNAIGIGVSLVIIVIAALNLVLDFDMIEQAAANGAPKYMEWYGGFSLLVTLIWLYLEILRLLAKLNSRR